MFVPAEELATCLDGLSPENAAKKAVGLMVKDALRSGMNRPYPIETIVMALSVCFADKDTAVPISDAEIRAYRALGVAGDRGATDRPS